jgi:coenzyme F420-0:L-glutamate ligase/coenzyme F420-1:gamma-L-glutamate ligase
VNEFSVRGLRGIPEVAEGDDLAALVADAAERAGGLEDGDVVVIAQKVVSKAEGRVVALDDVEPGRLASAVAGDRDPRYVEVVLAEASRLVRVRAGFLVAETRHGFVCASAGVDASNAPAPGRLVLLPEDPDASARRLRERLAELTGRAVAVLVTDSFGRPWRQGTTDVAVGAAGLRVLLDLKGEIDAVGYELHGTTIAVADEIAGAAELVLRKTAGVPAALVRGLAALAGEGSARDLVMPPERDLFR